CAIVVGNNGSSESEFLASVYIRERRRPGSVDVSTATGAATASGEHQGYRQQHSHCKTSHGKTPQFSFGSEAQGFPKQKLAPLTNCRNLRSGWPNALSFPKRRIRSLDKFLIS